MNIHDAIPNGFNEARKPIYTMRVDAIAAGIGEEARAQLSPFFLKAKSQQNFQQSSMEVLIRDFDHSDEMSRAFGIVRVISYGLICVEYCGRLRLILCRPDSFPTLQ